MSHGGTKRPWGPVVGRVVDGFTKKPQTVNCSRRDRGPTLYYDSRCWRCGAGIDHADQALLAMRNMRYPQRKTSKYSRATQEPG